MIPVAFLTHLRLEGSARFAEPIAQGMKEEGNPSFEELFTHFQGRNEAALPEVERDIPESPELMNTIREWLQTLPDSENVVEEIDWNTALAILEEAVMEKEELADLLEMMEAFVAADASVETFLNEVMAMLESISLEGVEDSLQEAIAALIPSLTALVAFATEQGEAPEQRGRQRSPYLQPWQQLGDRNVDQGLRDGTSGRTSQEWFQMGGRGQTSLPNVQPLGSHSPSSSPSFNETLSMQPLNQGQQLTIQLGEQKTDHARAVEFVKQFRQALGKGHVRVNGEGYQQITIKLYPESLGRLDVTISKEDGVLQARFLTTTGVARELVESQLTQLRHAFVQQQLPVERIVVEEMNTQQPEERKEENRSADDEEDPHEGETEGENGIQSFDEWLKAMTDEEEGGD